MINSKIRKNKKGSLLDIIYIGVVLTFFSMVVLVGLKIGTEARDQIYELDDSGAIDLSDTGDDAIRRTVDNYTYSVDNSFLIFTVMVGIASLVLAALVVVHPIFIPFYFIGLTLTIFFAGIASNIYTDMAADAQLVDIAAHFTFITNIMTILPWIVGVFGIILMVVMYKIRSFNTQ